MEQTKLLLDRLRLVADGATTELTGVPGCSNNSEFRESEVLALGFASCRSHLTMRQNCLTDNKEPQVGVLNHPVPAELRGE